MLLLNAEYITPGRSLPVDPAFLKEKVDAFYRERLDTPGDGMNVVRGRHPRPWSVRMLSNDYLALASDPRIIDAEVAALRGIGHGDAISRIFAQHHQDLKRILEQRIARLMLAEDAALCMSGYCANVGLIQAIAGPDVPVHIDLLAHASLWEGVAAARATHRAFRHNDCDHLEREIRRYGPGVVVVDALYSTDGALCRLADIVTVAERHGCVLVVDETHAFGTQGPRGAGLTVARGLAHKVHFRTVGLSKAVPSRGGVVVGSARNVEFFRYAARPLIFSTSVLPHEVAGYGAALDIIETEQWRRDRLHANHAYLRAGLDDLGYNVDPCDAQILALEAGSEANTFRLREALERRDVFGSGFCWPATPHNRSLVRLTVNAGLTQVQLDHVLRVCAEIRDEVGLADWPSTRRKRKRALAAE